MADTVSIQLSSGASGATVAAKTLSGWEDVEITLRAEGFPPSFRMGASSGQPLAKGETLARSGDACVVKLGADPVITGYVTGLSAQFSPDDHRVTIEGRGKTQDMVDAEVDWNQSNAYFTASLAAVQAIAGYYGIEVDAPAGIPTLPIEYPILLDYGTPGAEYIGQITRALGVLAYESADGKLVLSPAGSTTAASGAVYGFNVESCDITDSQEGRFSEVVACYFRQDQFLVGETDNPNVFETATDPAVLRPRKKHVFMGEGPQGQELAQQMARWEVARRSARGSLVRVTVDSWRDNGGTLWTPNTIVPLDLPGLSPNVGPYGLSEVTFRQTSTGGTTAEMTLLPIAGFTPEPVQLATANLVGVIGGSGATGQ